MRKYVWNFLYTAAYVYIGCASDAMLRTKYNGPAACQGYTTPWSVVRTPSHSCAREDTRDSWTLQAPASKHQQGVSCQPDQNGLHDAMSSDIFQLDLSGQCRALD